MSIKVMSQNVMCWEKEGVGLFADRRPLMKKAVTEHGADIIGFQEVTPRWKEYFDDDLKGYEYILKYREERRLEGVPIYWNPKKVTAIDSGYFWLSETPDVESKGWDAKCVRITSWVLFESNETKSRFAFVNTHLDHVGENARINGIQQVCDFITEKFGKEMPLILTGDFNASPESETLNKANSLLVDARAIANITTDEHTYHGFSGLKSIIDYIFLSKNISCKRFETVKESYNDVIQSDHFGIMAEIEF